MPSLQTNRLLQALPEEHRQSLLPLLEPVTLPLGLTLFEPGKRPEYAHFVTSGMVSLVVVMRNGSPVEVGICGPEGVPEVVFAIGPELGNKAGVVQLAGTALRMHFGRFEKAFENDKTLRDLLLRFVQYQLHSVEQVVACNTMHNVQQRLARWLLMVAARTGDDTMALTQEFLGQMLGTRRSSVTLAAGDLLKNGLIEYTRGKIRILDKLGLQKVTCECTGVIQGLLDGLYR